MMETIIATGDDTNNAVVDDQDVKLEFSAEEESVSIPSLSFAAVPQTSSKRKLTLLKKETKIEILQRLSRGESASSLAPIYGISLATVYNLKTKCHSSPKYASVIDAKTRHKFGLSRIGKKRNDAVHAWFEQKRNAGEVVTGPMLCQRAIELNDHFGGPSTFKASAGWLANFHSRWGIEDLKMASQKSTTIACFQDESAEQQSLGPRSLSSSVEPEITEPSSPIVKVEVLDEDESSLSPSCNQYFPSMCSMVERENITEDLQPNSENIKMEFWAEEETLSTQSFGLIENSSVKFNSKSLSTKRNPTRLTVGTRYEILNRLALGPDPSMSPSPPMSPSPSMSPSPPESPSQATTTKRKRKNLTIGAKIEILNRLANGETRKSLAKIYGIQRPCISIIKKARNKILAHASKFGSIGNAKNRRQLKQCQIVNLDDAVCEWILKKQNAGETLKGSMICKAARELNAKMGGPSTFKASSGWLRKFQLRCGLNQYRLPIKDDTKIGSIGSTLETLVQITKKLNQHESKSNSLSTNKSMLTSSPNITSNKQKLKRLTIETKVEILNRLAQGESVRSLAKAFGIGKTTVIDVRASRIRLLKYASKLSSSSKTKNRKTFREVKNTELDEAVYSWFLERRKAGKPVTAPMLCKKALELNNKMCSHPTFKATSGWLYRFRCRLGIRTFQIPTAKCYFKAKASAISLVLNKFRSLIETNSFRLDDVYNAYEFSILWKPMPKILLGSKVSQSAMRSAKERVSVLLCANASGSHRLPLLVVGKTDLCEDIPEVAGLPVVYKHQPQGWLTKDIFSHWYSNVFIAKVKEFRSSEGKSGKCLLVAGNLRNRPPNVELNHIDTDFEVSSLLSPHCEQMQPMIQLLMKFNMLYQKNVLLWLLDSDKRKLICQAFEDFNIINACSLLASSWNAVLVEDVKKAWLKLWPTDDNQDTESDNEIETNDILQETLTFLSSVDGLDNCTPEIVKDWLEFNTNVLALNPVVEKNQIVKT